MKSLEALEGRSCGYAAEGTVVPASGWRFAVRPSGNYEDIFSFKLHTKIQFLPQN
jgi:hypothetical protein